VEENCARLGITCVDQRAEGLSPTDPAHPSRLAGDTLTARFDRVLVDAPCSNTGVMRRRVDLRWRLKPGEILRLVDTQRGLLERAAGLVKLGGCIVYSTCSLEPEENGQLVRRFLSEAKGFDLEDEQQVTPWEDGVDGAYAASLKRKV
jgi:16S rRNA (cytosine967-C5)-methyltransferase